MITNTAQIESYEEQAKAWPEASTEAVVRHHEEVLNQTPGIGERPIVVNGAKVDINPQQVMRDALKAHRESQVKQSQIQPPQSLEN